MVPFDGSKPSVNALKHALEIAETSGENAEITLLYVIEKILLPPLTREEIRSPKTGDVIDREQILKEIYYEEKKSATDMLAKAIESIHAQNVRMRLKVMYGLAYEQIVKHATKEKTDLIVIGNIGLSGISRLKAMGSVSRAVSECAPCPVMIVH